MEDSSSLRFHLADLQLCLETLPISKTFGENELRVSFFSLDTARYIAFSFSLSHEIFSFGYNGQIHRFVSYENVTSGP